MNRRRDAPLFHFAGDERLEARGHRLAGTLGVLGAIVVVVLALLGMFA